MTPFIKKKEVKKDWYLINAENAAVGRLASYISKVLRGKNKPEYTPNQDCGDNLIIINSDKIKLTGKKEEDKLYYRHTGYPGGLKESNPKQIRRKKAQYLFIYP